MDPLIRGSFMTFVLVVCFVLQCQTDPVIEGHPIVANLYEDTRELTKIVCLTCTVPDDSLTSAAPAAPAAPASPAAAVASTVGPTGTSDTTGGASTTLAVVATTATATAAATAPPPKHSGRYEISDTGISPSHYCTGCFDVYKLPDPQDDKNNYCLYYLPSQGSLSYGAIRQYNITVSCTDDLGHTSSEIVQVRILTNQPPVITSPEIDKCNKEIDHNLKRGGVVYDAITVKDNNSDPLFYSMTTDPPSPNFEIGENDGVIRAAADLVHECNSQVKFNVTVTDKQNHPVGPIEITCKIKDPSQPVTILNANRIITKPEREEGLLADLIFQPEKESLSIPQFDIRTEPPEALLYIQKDPLEKSNQKLTLTKELNYENTGFRNFNISITPRNNKCPSKTYWLYVKIEDVNDPVTLGPKEVKEIVDEGKIKINFHEYFSVFDEDQLSGDDTWEYSLVGPPLGFKINRFTGEITTADYNVDPDPNTGEKPDQDIELTIRVKDSKGTDVNRRYSDTVKLNLHIRDVNDNRPYFTKTGFSWSVRECDGLGNELGSMGKPKYLIKDNDLGERGESALTNCVPTDNGEIAVSADCKVYHIGRIEGGTSSTLHVYGTDRGTHYKRLLTAAPATVVVTSTVCVTPTKVVPDPVTSYDSPSVSTIVSVVYVTHPTQPVTTTAPTPAKNTSNLAWIIPAAILGALALAGLSYLMWKYCTCDTPPPPTPPTPRKPVTPPTPEPPKRTKTPDPPEPPPVEEAEVKWVYSGTSVSYDYSTAEVATQQVVVQNVQPVAYEVQPVAYEMQPLQVVGTQPYVTY